MKREKREKRERARRERREREMRGERRERREASPRTEADTTEIKHATDGVEGGRRRRIQLVRQSHTFIGGRTRRSQDVRKHSLPSDTDRREFLPNICGRCPRRRCCLRFVVGARGAAARMHALRALWLQSDDPAIAALLLPRPRALHS